MEPSKLDELQQVSAQDMEEEMGETKQEKSKRSRGLRPRGLRPNRNIKRGRARIEAIARVKTM